MKKINFKDKKTIAIIIAIAVLLITVIVLFATGTVERLLAELGVLKIEQVEPEVTFYQHIPKGDGDVYIIEDHILIADNVGVSCYDTDGTWQWEEEINLKSPVFIPDGEEGAVLGDIGGNGIYGFDKEGLTFRYVFDTQIVNVSDSVAEKQIIVIHSADNYLSAATLVDFSSEVKVVATRKFSQYYMMSASVSEDGEQVAIGGIASEGGTTSTVIAFMNMKGYELFTTEKISDEFLPIVSYVDGDNLFAAGGDHLRRIVKNSVSETVEDVNDMLWDRDGGSNKIVATVKTEDRFITVSTVDGAETGTEASCTVNIYSSDGSLGDSFNCQGGIKAVKAYGKIITLYSENEIFVYNIYGQLIGTFDGVSQISDVEYISEKTLAVCGTSKVAKVDFS